MPEDNGNVKVKIQEDGLPVAVLYKATNVVPVCPDCKALIVDRAGHRKSCESKKPAADEPSADA